MRFTERLKNWLMKRGEPAKSWRPLVAILAACIVGALALHWRTSPDSGGTLAPTERTPAGVVEISDSEAPAASAENAPASATRGFALEIIGGPSKQEIETRTGVTGKRARAVRVMSDLLVNRKSGKEMRLPLALFHDVKPVVHLKVLSAHEANTGIHSGHIPDDPNSRVQLTTLDGSVSGFITYRGREYQIIPDPEKGIHYIIEQ